MYMLEASISLCILVPVATRARSPSCCLRLIYMVSMVRFLFITLEISCIFYVFHQL